MHVNNFNVFALCRAIYPQHTPGHKKLSQYKMKTLTYCNKRMDTLTIHYTVITEHEIMQSYLICCYSTANECLFLNCVYINCYDVSGCSSGN